MNLNDIQEKLGIDINKQELLDILESLNLEVLEDEKIPADAIGRPELDLIVNIKVPSYRRDLNISEDILEEIVRLHGYENVEPTLPKRTIAAPRKALRHQRQSDMKISLAGSGLYEIVTYTMVGPVLFKNAMMNTETMITIENPISPELSLVRNSLVPSVIEKLQLNSSKYDEFGLFEISRVAEQEKGDENLPKQEYRLSAGRIGKNEVTTYRQLKYALDVLGRDMFTGLLEIRPSQEKSIPTYLHPGKAGEIYFNNVSIGGIGVLHPKVLKNFGLEGKSVSVFEMNIEGLLDYEKEDIRELKKISDYPPVVRDLSFWQADRSYLGVLIDTVKAVDLLIDRVDLLDMFVKDNRQSFTLRLVLQSATSTLESSQIDEVVEKVKEMITKQGHEFRG
jgi:phenylalanyl-tRNA synthetase beta chain